MHITIAPELEGAVEFIEYCVKKGVSVSIGHSNAGAGLGDGTYEFGGFKVIVEKGIARKEDGTLVSSTLTICNAVKNMMKFTEGSLEDIVLMASKILLQQQGYMIKWVQSKLVSEQT